MTVSDTSLASRARQIRLVRDASVARRFEVVRTLTRTVVALSRRAIRRRRPGATEAEIDRAFAELHYGVELTRRLMGR